jgi:clan AA aspartic protease (TIGR02281 family)
MSASGSDAASVSRTTEMRAGTHLAAEAVRFSDSPFLVVRSACVDVFHAPVPNSRSIERAIPGSSMSVAMRIEGGTYVVPVLINNAITLDFIVDSGASDVSIPADVVSTLVRTGTLKDSDFLGQKTYVLADGSTVPSQTFRIRSLKVGDKILENVYGSVASSQGSLLLGQSFLSRFKSWSVDNTKHSLVLE